MANLRNAYYQKVTSDEDDIPTLLTFSTDIGDAAKQLLIEYLKRNHFRIDSFSIPLSELICYHFWKNGQFIANPGKEVILLQAIDSTLNLSVLSFHDNYFIENSNERKSYKEKGLDPRRKAMVKFVVETVNRATGFLSTDEEKFAEIKRLHQFAEGWLNRLDNTRCNMPLNIQGVSFANSVNNRRDVIVYKRNVEEDTGSFIQELIDIFNVFEMDNVGGHAYTNTVILFGDCFNNELIKKRFLQTVGLDKLLIFSNNELFNVLVDYPKIDINRYSDQAKRLKALAAIEVEKMKIEKAAILKGQYEAEEKEKLAAKLKEKAHQFKDEAESATAKAKDYFAELKTKGGDALKEHMADAEKLMQNLFGHPSAKNTGSQG